MNPPEDDRADAIAGAVLFGSVFATGYMLWHAACWILKDLFRR